MTTNRGSQTGTRRASLRRRAGSALVVGLGAAVWAAVGCGQDQFVGAGYSAAYLTSPGAADASCNDPACVNYGLALDAGLVQQGPTSSGIHPSFGPTRVASKPPPAISGGTLLVTHDGSRAVAADADRDVVYVVDLAKRSVATVALHAGDEPGRLVEDGAGRVHVALRAGGALVTIDPATGSIQGRRAVCPAPRGVAWDASADAVLVACATGELVSLPAAGGAATHIVVVERDLRDVVVAGTSIAVSQFRSAQLLTLDGSGNVARRDQLPSPQSSFSPHVAWRTVAGPSGTFVSVHQAESTQSLATHVVGGYGGGCGGFGALPSSGGPPPSPPSPQDLTLPASDSGFGGLSDAVGAQGAPAYGTFAACALTPDAGTVTQNGGRSGGAPAPPPPPPGFPGGGPCFGPESGAVLSALTVLGADGSVLVSRAFGGVLPVDVAVSGAGTTVAAVAAGNAFSALDTVFVFTQCGANVLSGQVLSAAWESIEPVAVAFDAKDEVLVQTREPAQLSIFGAQTLTPLATVALSSVTRADTGHDVFHTQAGGMVACGSCHPEGRDDGHVWVLDGSRRRTPSLRGTIAGTAPYHWPGDQKDLNVLVNDVYTVRMSGGPLVKPVMDALTGWVQHVPELPAPTWVDPAAASRGQVLFERTDVGCATCHSGPKFTNNVTVDVGTGGAFQVPPLVGVGWRTPLFHDGCAATIADRFGPCATARHGSLGSLSTQDISDLIAYLETL